MIDETDRQIILALRQQGRSSNMRMAQNIGLSESTVAKRVEKILEDGIIRVQAVLNPFKLGYVAHAFIAMDVDLTQVQSVCDKLMTNRNVSMINTSFGRFDVVLIVDFPNWEMLFSFINEELCRIQGVRKLDTFIVSEIKKRYQSIFVNDAGSTSPMTIDEIDQKLVNFLEEDGRISYTSLAKKSGISLAAASRRINFMLNNNIIRIIAVPNPAKLGFPASAHLALNIEKRKVGDVCDVLVKYPSIHSVMTTMNGFEAVVGVSASSSEALFEFLTEKIARLPGVLNIETFARAELKKATYATFEMDRKLFSASLT
jgi:DNA-binding Lrp family transcriptional regulator